MASKKDNRTIESAGSREQGMNIFYRPSKATKDGWDINRLPIKRESPQSPVINLGSNSGSCVLAGTPVLMADGSSKLIETFVGGEIVRTLTGVSRVRAVESPRLGVTRRIIEMRAGAGDPLYISDEHAIWTRFDDAGVTAEWWGVYNFNHYLVEKANGVGVSITRDARPLRFDVPQTHAHIDGWKHVQPIYHLMDPDTPLFHLDVETGGSYIAGGFIISSHASDADSIGVEWKAKPDEVLESFIAVVSSAV